VSKTRYVDGLCRQRIAKPSERAPDVPSAASALTYARDCAPCFASRPSRHVIEASSFPGSRKRRPIHARAPTPFGGDDSASRPADESRPIARPAPFSTDDRARSRFPPRPAERPPPRAHADRRSPPSPLRRRRVVRDERFSSLRETKTEPKPKPKPKPKRAASRPVSCSVSTLRCTRRART
jgi:hypothetical protein